MLAIVNLMRFVLGSTGFYSPAFLQALKRRFNCPNHTDPFFAQYDFKKPSLDVYTFGSILNFLGLYTRDSAYPCYHCG